MFGDLLVELPSFTVHCYFKEASERMGMIFRNVYSKTIEFPQSTYTFCFYFDP